MFRYDTTRQLEVLATMKYMITDNMGMDLEHITYDTTSGQNGVLRIREITVNHLKYGQFHCPLSQNTQMELETACTTYDDIYFLNCLREDINRAMS